MYKIFVNIACYKDTDLVNTINDAIVKAKFPNRIYFGVSEQAEFPNKILPKLGNVRYIYCHFLESKGTGWHRNEIYKELYNGEEFCLTVDSHCRFKKDWDETYINTLLERGENTILTGFPPHFDFHESYDYYTKERPVNTYNKIVNISEYHQISGEGAAAIHNFAETAVVSGSNTFSSGAFTQLSLYDEYLHPFLDQEIVSCMAYMYAHKVEYMQDALIWHNYRNNSPGSDEKYRMLVSEEVILQGYIYNFVEVFDKRKTPRTATQWTEHILKFKQ
jgi:hypothetical protein